MNWLGFLTITGLAVLVLLAVFALAAAIVVFIRDWRQDAQAGKHAPQDSGWIEYTENGYPPELAYRFGRVGDDGPAPYERELLTPAAAVEHAPDLLPPPAACIHGWPDADCGCGQREPEWHHDEYAPVQEWHPEPAEPAQADEAHQAAIAVGALIAATAAQIAAKERARAAELEAEAQATRPWEDDTGTFTAICTEVA